MAELLYRLGKGAAHRAWLVITAWVVALGVAAVAFVVGYGGLSSSYDIPGTESGAVVDELAETLPEYAGASGTVVFHTEDGSALTEEQQEQISALIADADGLDDVSEVVDPFTTEQERADNAQEIVDGRAEIEDSTAELEDGQAQLDDASAQLDEAQSQLDDARAQLEAAGMSTAELDAQQEQLDASRAEIADQQQQIDDGYAEIEDAIEQLDLAEELMTYAENVRMVSEDGSAALASVAFTETRLELPEESKQGVIDHFSSVEIEGVQVDFSTEIAQGVPQIFGTAEAIGLIIAAIVLLVMLGSVIAASFPIVTALVGVGAGVLASLAFSGVVEMTSVTPVLGIMLGLAVGIDYSLFIVNRHRKQLLQGAEISESIGLANGTSGNAVVFAGSTVVVALLALNITGIPFLGTMGTVGAACVAIAVLIAITLIPAMLGLAGERVLSRKSRAIAAAAREKWKAADADASAAVGTDADAAPRRARAIRPMSTLRAVVTAVVAVAALAVVAIPSASMRLGLPDGASEPEGSTTNIAYTVIEEQFGAGTNGALLVVATLDEAVSDDDLIATEASLASQLYAFDSVSAVAPIDASDDGTVIAFQVVPVDGPNSETTEQLVLDLREAGELDGGATLGVAGQAASNIDISAALSDVLPLYLAIVVGLSLIIMVGVFRSLLVPLIATGGFILSLYATLGAIVAVFQWGWLAEVFGITSTGPILSFLPVILVGILFGLAMDYQLFLATGMREAYVHGAPARQAVTQGFRAGRSVVIAAALIMISVFGGFVFAESVIIRVIGFGLAFGVLVDAFVVRLLLMPALMHMIGKSAWWLPRWLDRILPDVDVEGAALERRHHLHH